MFHVAARYTASRSLRTLGSQTSPTREELISSRPLLFVQIRPAQDKNRTTHFGVVLFPFARATGFEPAIFPVTGGRFSRLSYARNNYKFNKNERKSKPAAPSAESAPGFFTIHSQEYQPACGASIHLSNAKNSFSFNIFTPKRFALSSFEPGSEPTTT